jgi:TPP-dependent pyruvate/acetoin dehydrogenase alpha subunit
VADPIALCRQRLLATGRLDEAGVTALEAAVRDEIAAAGRAISLACTR